MGLQENASKYMRMDDVRIEDDDVVSSKNPGLGGSDGSRKFVFGCAIFASLNSVLLGYGEFLLFFLFIFI